MHNGVFVRKLWRILAELGWKPRYGMISGWTWREIDAELRLFAAVRWSIREHGGEPLSRLVDERLRDGEMDC